MEWHFHNKGIKYIVIFILVANFTTCCNASIGEECYIESLFRYDLPTDYRYAQGMDIINGRVFQAFSDGTIEVIDIVTRKKMQTIGPLCDEGGKALHMNDISFRREDDVTYMITSGNRINSNLHLFKIIEESGVISIEKEDLFPPPLIDQTSNKDASQYFGAGEYCVQVGYLYDDNDWYGDSLIECYHFDEFSADIQYTQLWSRVCNKLWAMQGAVILDESCYMAVGVPHGDATIYRINLNDGSLSCYKDFRKRTDMIPNEEMQGLAFYDNSFYFSTTYGLYKLL